MPFLSLWSVYFLILADFCHFSLVPSFLASFLLRLSASKAQKPGSPKENNDFGCFLFVLDFYSKHLKDAQGKRMLSLL